MPRDTKTSLDKPKHVPVYFPKITSLSAKDIPHFRKVVHTGLFSQVVLMNIPVGGDIGEEVHLVDQALTFTQGEQPNSVFRYAMVLIVAEDVKIKHRPRT